MLPRFLLISAAAVVSIATGAGQSPPSNATWSAREAPPHLQMVIARADLIIVAVHDALLRELGEGLARGGPGRPWHPCHTNASGVSWRVARFEGIASGPEPAIASVTHERSPGLGAPLVQANAGRLARDVDGFAVDLGTEVGVLRPIVEQSMCAGCHGPVDRITPEVRQMLAARYPKDRATGFTLGQIRGWYWVEMPKPH
jgi:hypothetical protein